MTKSNWRNELYLGEVAGTVGKTVTKKIVRQGIKVGGKRGGRAAQGAVASGKTATQHAMQKKEAGKGEKIGKVVGGIAGGITGGALGAPLGGVGAIGTGIAGGEVGERLGGAIGKKFDKKEAKKKKPVGITTAVKKEETLLYDVVHDYIISENFASDTEGANKVMLKLSDELMQEIYERTMTASEKRKDTMLKKKYDDSDMKKNMQGQYGKEEGKKVYFATIRKQAMKKEEVILERQKTNQGERQSEEQHQSTYGKATVRNKRKFGFSGGQAINAPKHLQRGTLIDKRREEHKAKRGVKTKGMKEEVGITTHSMMMKDKAKKEAMIRMKERDAVAKKLRKEEVKRDEYGDPVGGPKITKKQLKKNLAANAPDEDHTNTTAEGYGSDRVGPALTMARAIDKVNPRPKPNSKRTMASRALKMASIKKDEKIRKRKENPYSTDKKLKMVATSIRDRVKQKAKSIMKSEDYIPEEGYDVARDQGRVRPSKDKKDATTMPPSKEMKKTQKVNKGDSALELVRKKYGKSVMGTKK